MGVYVGCAPLWNETFVLKFIWGKKSANNHWRKVTQNQNVTQCVFISHTCLDSTGPFQLWDFVLIFNFWSGWPSQIFVRNRDTATEMTDFFIHLGPKSDWSSILPGYLTHTGHYRVWSGTEVPWGDGRGWGRSSWGGCPWWCSPGRGTRFSHTGCSCLLKDVIVIWGDLWWYEVSDVTTWHRVVYRLEWSQV